MFELIKSGTQIDFVGKRQLWFGLSIVFILATIVLWATKGLNYGIDFTGGAEVQIKVPSSWNIGMLRETLDAKTDLKGLKVVSLGEASSGQFLIKAQGDEKSLNLVSQKVETALSATLQKNEYEMQRVDVVGPAAGSTLRESGFLSLIYSLLCILIYVSVRFDMRYSPGAVLALLHDSMITLGIFILMQKQFDLQILAALLALIGYSNNDTIIVYDRVRETNLLNPKMPIEEIVNRAVNETLGRTILTSICTFVSAFCLWWLGGDVIRDFAFTFMVGILVGTYSSIFIASSIVIFMTNYQQRKNAKGSGKSQRKKVVVRPEPKFQEQ